MELSGDFLSTGYHVVIVRVLLTSTTSRSIENMLTNANKRPAFCDLTNVEGENNAAATNENVWKFAKYDASRLLPEVSYTQERSCLKVDDDEEMKPSKHIYTQNIHPALAMYHCDGTASPNVSWCQLQHLLHPDEEDALYFLRPVI